MLNVQSGQVISQQSWNIVWSSYRKTQARLKSMLYRRDRPETHAVGAWRIDFQQFQEGNSDSQSIMILGLMNKLFRRFFSQVPTKFWYAKSNFRVASHQIKYNRFYNSTG